MLLLVAAREDILVEMVWLFGLLLACLLLVLVCSSVLVEDWRKRILFSLSPLTHSCCDMVLCCLRPQHGLMGKVLPLTERTASSECVCIKVL